MQATLFSRILQALDNPWVVATLALVVIGVRLLWVGYRRRHPLPAPTRPPAPRDPLLAGVEVGIVLLALSVLGFELAPAPAVIIGAVVLLMVGEAFSGTIRKARPAEGKRARAEAPPRAKDLGLEIIDTLLIALVLVFGIVRPFLLQTFYIPSPSMEPTLLAPYNPAKPGTSGVVVHGKARGGDKLIANKFVYRFREPQRGEIVVFRPPDEALIGNNFLFQLRRWITDPNGADRASVPAAKPGPSILPQLPEVPAQRDDYIKRVIGIAGDRIHIVAGEGVYLNGVLQAEPYVPQRLKESMGDFPVIRQVPPLPVEDWQDEFAIRDWYHYYYLFKAKIEPHIEKGDFVVPPGSVFVMGDNRSPSGSFDSRYWGVVPVKDVKARAVSTFWPLSRLTLL